ncbi:surface antigen-like protein [Lotmaria passim]
MSFFSFDVAPVQQLPLLLLLLLLCFLPAHHQAYALCQVPNCVTCSPNNEFYCETCVGPEFIHANGQCSPRGTCSITACEKCEEGTISRCETCEPGYVRTVNGLCASLVVCDMDTCEPQEAQRSRIAHTTVECSLQDSVKEDGVYVCVASRTGSGSGAAGSLLSRVPWWLCAAISTACAVGFGMWVLSRLCKRA